MTDVVRGSPSHAAAPDAFEAAGMVAEFDRMRARVARGWRTGGDP
jgi:hypothetical protein